MQERRSYGIQGKEINHQGSEEYSDRFAVNSREPKLLGTVWQELKRRKVVQVAVVYVFMAWGVMQVGELLFAALQVPDGAYTLLVILVLLGFPVAVVLAWAYEITPEGVRRDLVRELRQEQVERINSAFPRKKPGEVLPRIAILPLRDMAPDHDLSHFCEGVAEEIQNSLCNVPGLEVIARAHSFQYGGKRIRTEKIVADLGASAIIEGSVRRINDTYRISVQLVDVATSTDVWSHSLEVPLDDDFTVQKLVADRVAHDTMQTFQKSGDSTARGEQMTLGYF